MEIPSQRLEDIARQHAKAIADRLSDKERYQELINYIKDSFKYPDNSSVDFEALLEDMYSYWETYCSSDMKFSEYLNTFDITEDEVLMINTHSED
jgi:hypothetical protein